MHLGLYSLPASWRAKGVKWFPVIHTFLGICIIQCRIERIYNQLHGNSSEELLQLESWYFFK